MNKPIESDEKPSRRACREARELRVEAEALLINAFYSGLGIIPKKEVVCVYLGPKRVSARHMRIYERRYKYVLETSLISKQKIYQQMLTYAATIDAIRSVINDAATEAA